MTVPLHWLPVEEHDSISGSAISVRLPSGAKLDAVRFEFDDRDTYDEHVKTLEREGYTLLMGSGDSFDARVRAYLRDPGTGDIVVVMTAPVTEEENYSILLRAVPEDKRAEVARVLCIAP